MNRQQGSYHTLRSLQVSDTIIRQISDLDTPSCWGCGGSHSKMAVFMLGEAPCLLALASDLA